MNEGPSKDFENMFIKQKKLEKKSFQNTRIFFEIYDSIYD
jgi:hypothetical protein